jgi:putative glutamine amidotransferase
MDCLDCYLPAARPKALLSCSSMNDAATPERNVLALRELANNAASALQIAGFEPTLLQDMTVEAASRLSIGDYELLVILGGADVHPSEYHAEIGSTTLCNSDHASEKNEIALIQSGLSMRKDVFAICRGMQLLNVACGGALRQELGADGAHYVPANSTSFVSHSVKLSDSSHLAQILGSREIQIHSAHHQSIERLGQGLSIAGEASDGVIEAIELTGDNFVIGVQWHPEATDADRTDLAAIFGAFAANVAGKLQQK